MVGAQQAAAAALSWLEASVKRAPRNRHEALALLVHAVMLQHGFRPASTPYSENNDKKLPEDWAEHGYGGIYKHHRSGLSFELRMVPLGGALCATAAVVEQDTKRAQLELRVESYVRDDAKIASTDELDWNHCFKDVDDAASRVALELAYKLVPESSKSSETGTSAAAAPASSSSPRRPQRDYDDDPLRVGGPPRRPLTIGGEELRPMRPLNVGDDDLFPPELRPGRRGGPMPDLPGTDWGGGSHVGPDHPMFRPRFGPDGGIGAPRLPRGAVPPGARFDPFGPPGVGGSGYDPSRFGPDNDHEPPPPDMYL